MSYSRLNLNAKKILDYRGQKKTLAHGQHSFVLLNNKYINLAKTRITSKPKKILFLGLGYNANVDALPFLTQGQEAFFHEFSDFTKACADENITCDKPLNFTPLSKDEIYELLAKDEDVFSHWEIIIYHQNLTLFPSYWFNFLAELEDIIFQAYQNLFQKKATSYKNRSIFVAGSPSDLMFKEICLAVQSLNFEVISMASQNTNSYQELSELLRHKKPKIFLSVNGRNLDGYGQVYALLEKLQIPLVLWIVDNPWNILSGFKDDWWKNCQIYLTDKSFMPALKSCGAKNVNYLPLAASNINYPVSDAITRDILYVGHSAFQKKQKFFAAQSVEQGFFEQGKQEILDCLNSHNNSTKLPNYHKIFNQILTKHSFYQNPYCWLDNELRQISLVGHELDIFHKSIWLEKLASSLTLIGDLGWTKILSNLPDLIEPVDYYKTLPNYYSKAKFTLNITSLLMPSALTQRHFDVWNNKGFLLSSPSDGLSIFPNNLASEIIINKPEQLLDKIDYFNQNPNLYSEIKRSFSDEIVKEHLYPHRINAILQKYI